MSLPEVKLWNLLRRSPQGMRFRRQHPIGPFVADFYCPAAKLVIEIDGSAHDFDERARRDESRDQYLRSLGLEIRRIAAAEVLADVTAVGDALIALCQDIAGPSTTQLR